MTKTPRQTEIQLAGYRLVQRVARGGMGSVFRAVQTSIDRTVAVKILATRYAKDQVFVERFLREARAAARLNHPNIVQAIDVGQARGHYYFAMEFIEGPTLAALLRRRGPLPCAEAVEIIRQVARALEHAGRHGMLHLDVKPANIMLTSAGVAKLADFGLARHVEDEDTIYASKKIIFGTPCYMSPEQIRGDVALDGRSDIWSLGVTFYELVTGRNPFADKDQRATLNNIRAGRVPSVREAQATVPEEVSRVMAKMMAPDRDERYPDAATLLTDLDALSKGHPPPIAMKLPLAGPRTALAPPRPRPRVPWVALILLALPLAAGVSTALYLSWQKKHPPSPPPGPIVVPPRIKPDDPVPRLFRECVVQAAEALESGEFAKAAGLYESFAETHKGTPWEQDARLAVEDVRKQAVRRAEALAGEADAAAAKEDFAAARARAAEIEAIRLPQTAPLAADVLRRVAAAEEAARRREAVRREQAALAARADLQRKAAALTTRDEFVKAAALCDAFLANPDFVPASAVVRQWREGFLLLENVRQALLSGAQNAQGLALTVEGRRMTAVGVTEGKLRVEETAAGAGRRETLLPLSEVPAATLAELLRRSPAHSAETRAGLALYLKNHARHLDALAVLSAARRGAPPQYAAMLAEVERDSLLGGAREEIEARLPFKALTLLRRLRSLHGGSAWYRESLPEIASVFNRARDMMYEPMRLIAAGAFVNRKDARVYVPIFYMDTHEVTNAQYAAFLKDVAAHGAKPYQHWAQPSGKTGHVPLEWERIGARRPDHPVVGVDWFDAYAFAKWAGKRLPREIEWEKAARWDPRAGTPRKYPWGDEWKADGRYCNSVPPVVASPGDVPTSTVPVGSFPRGHSAFGCADMAGNVREWAADDEEGKTLGDYAPVRGGSFKDHAVSCSTTARVAIPRLTRDLATGFRCALDPIRDGP